VRLHGVFDGGLKILKKIDFEISWTAAMFYDAATGDGVTMVMVPEGMPQKSVLKS